MRVAYIDCRLFDGTDECEVIPHATIITENDRIAEVRTGGACALPDPAEVDEVVDLAGAFVMPGMINAHAHHFGFGKPSSTLSGGFAQKAILLFARTPAGKMYLRMTGRKALEAALFSGVTTERGVGDLRYVDVELRDLIAAGKVDGPRFIVSGPAITVATGHGAGTFAEVAETPEEFAACVDDRVAHGVDFIKICTTGGVMDSQVKGEAGVLRMSLEQTRAVCDRAAEHGLYVASHTEGPEGVAIDIDGGVYTVEHGSNVDDKVLERFAKSGAAAIMTASVALPLKELPTSQTKLFDVGQYNSNLIYERMIEGARQCRAAGIPVGLGTDAACPFSTHYDLWHEVLLFSRELGAPADEALRTVTLGNARILRIADEVGSIEPGKSADFIAIDGDPLSDLHDLRHVTHVVARGKHFEGCEERLAGYRLPEIDAVLEKIYA